jgi:hypothetical protein
MSSDYICSLLKSHNFPSELVYCLVNLMDPDGRGSVGDSRFRVVLSLLSGCQLVEKLRLAFWWFNPVYEDRNKMDIENSLSFVFELE